MSFLIGPVSGALVAGGIYYGFSNLIHTRTDQLSKDLQTLSARLIEHPTLVQAPPPAAARITHHPFSSLLKDKWNQEIAKLFLGFGS
ncbi:putative component of the MICOS complex, a large protein complex of the mitochondrial inner membrane that plays crucial roles in the maintenance of crista junctions, inner membrane architecture, and formation of contact sites to the outer membrane [Lyophyllum shimeji]|uniref:MICOS complex subunit MIC12 n=1 Tax=Lyophyllum shimeji TaxID=47721 RepID=A0A9P3PQX4_LYOSH|nr:putative component of the MICOS complex, a large protein complex of the mitochondrial inner membrane that plays crucial roles in the maintenance of crista junctions, inner membrane architecture, and formation of contact sites to the outer membrane [Lyophyllum shimeji]